MGLRLVSVQAKSLLGDVTVYLNPEAVGAVSLDLTPLHIGEPYGGAMINMIGGAEIHCLLPPEAIVQRLLHEASIIPEVVLKEKRHELPV